MGKTSVITTDRRCARFLSVQQYMNPASEGGLAVNKVIFLDVDGVLNNGTWAIECLTKAPRATTTSRITNYYDANPDQ